MKKKKNQCIVEWWKKLCLRHQHKEKQKSVYRRMLVKTTGPLIINMKKNKNQCTVEWWEKMVFTSST
jgi:hypothetical protein